MCLCACVGMRTVHVPMSTCMSCEHYVFVSVRVSAYAARACCARMYVCPSDVRIRKEP